MNVLFTFENPLPNRLADAEVFFQTAKALAGRLDGATLLLPANGYPLAHEGQLKIRQVWAPLWPAGLRHLWLALSLPWRREFREADLIYTRNLLVALLALLAGQYVAFDHYRPWGDQLPPLQPLLRWLFNHSRCVVCISHSHLTRRCYERIGVLPHKLVTVHTGYDPAPFRPALSQTAAKGACGFAPDRPLVVYAGRVNHKKGLDVVLQAAKRLSTVDFALVGAEGGSAVEAMATELANVRLTPFQKPADLPRYLYAADVLLIPPATAPLQIHGSTVLPLKTYLYLAAGRPIIAGRTPDACEVLRHKQNAWLVDPDRPDDLVQALRTVLGDAGLQTFLARNAHNDAANFTWEQRAMRILAQLSTRLHRAQPFCFLDTLRETLRWLLQMTRTARWAMPRRYGA